MKKNKTTTNLTDYPLFRIGNFTDIESKKYTKSDWEYYSQLKGNLEILKWLGITDLTQKVYEKKLGLRIGMAKTIGHVLVVMSKMECNTPLVFGECGVGKSSLPICLSYKIVNGKVPARFKYSRVLNLNLINLSASMGGKGELSEKLQHFENFLQDNPHAILVIDEYQYLVDKNFVFPEISQFLKFHISSGEHRFILITDLEGVKRLTENTAFTGRIVSIEIPSANKRIVKHLFKGTLESQLFKHHKVNIPLNLVDQAFELSENVLMYDRAQPARTVKLVDTALANESLRLESLGKLNKNSQINSKTLKDVVNSFFKINHSQSTKSEDSNRLDELSQNVKKVIIGQDDIINAICSDLILKHHQKLETLKVYFFFGNSGIGKTKLAYEIGNALSGHNHVHRIDCSQLFDKWSLTSIAGSFPGLVMSDQSSLLSKVRINPYTTFIWDEIEKAHPDVYLLFLQILQPPHIISDNRGVKLDFSRSTFFFTSNIGHSKNEKLKMGFQKNLQSKDNDLDCFSLTKYFPDEFIGRLGKNVYRLHTLSMNDLLKILALEISNLEKRFGLNIHLSIEVKKALINTKLCERFGVRGLQSEISRRVEPILYDIRQNLNKNAKINHSQAFFSLVENNIKGKVKENINKEGES
jgi:ATP-dependent Clp protease ATP-binding subunit ClpA